MHTPQTDVQCNQDRMIVNCQGEFLISRLQWFDPQSRLEFNASRAAPSEWSASSILPRTDSAPLGKAADADDARLDGLFAFNCPRQRGRASNST
jgi:hypothetical protein